MKARSLTIRGCSPKVRRVLKKSAVANRRTVNGEAAAWLKKQADQQKICTGAEAAEILRRADALLDDEDRRQIAAGIEKARRLMNNEHLH